MDAMVGAEPENQAVSGSEKTAVTTIQPMAAAAKAGAQPGQSESSLGADSTTPVCRICYKRANVDCGPLVAPCSCKGSIGFAHKSCIERWLRDRTTDQCTVCLASLNVRRTPAPLYKFFADRNHRRDVTRIILNLLSCAGDVLVITFAWSYAVEFLDQKGWFLKVLIGFALVFQTLFWILVEIVRAWTCYMPIRAWRNQTTSVELVLHEAVADTSAVPAASDPAVDLSSAEKGEAIMPTPH